MTERFKELLALRRDLSRRVDILDNQIAGLAPAVIAKAVRKGYPDARYVLLDWSDQAGHLEIYQYLRSDHSVIVDFRRHEPGDEDTELSGYASWLSRVTWDAWHHQLKRRFLSGPNAGEDPVEGGYVLDITAVLGGRNGHAYRS
jgi:hypothetical protein